MASRSLDAARMAFQTASASPDLARVSSREIHMSGVPCEDGHMPRTSFLKFFLHSGTKASLFALSMASAVATSNISPKLVCKTGIILGVAGSLISAGHRLISSASYAELYFRERSRESWETTNYLEGEIKEMVELYVSKGVDEEDALQIVNLMSKNPRFFVDVMMLEELGLAPADAEGEPWIQAAAKMSGSLLFLTIPIFPLLLSMKSNAITEKSAEISSLGISFISPILLGVYEANATHTSAALRIFRVTFLCSIIAVSSSLVSRYIEKSGFF